MAIELVPLAHMIVELDVPFVLDGTPAGGRWIFEVGSGRLEGDRLNATLKGRALADWLTVGPDMIGTVDVRGLFETHDGALVYLQYHGRVDIGAGAPVTYIAPRFETGDDRYRWLNKIQAVGKGALDGSTLTYELYEVR
jgi:hypothetical protein